MSMIRHLLIAAFHYLPRRLSSVFWALVMGKKTNKVNL